MPTEHLAQLPSPPQGKTGWPWQEESEKKNTGSDWPCPKITVVTPSFNQGEYLEATIRSVLLQNYPNLEYFVMDGGSSDQSLALIEKYAPWIDHWESQPDRGQTHAINKGFGRATGQYLNWLNSDDLLAKNALWEVAHYFEEHPDVAMVNGGMIYFNASGETTLSIAKTVDPLLYLSTFCYHQPACFFQRNLLTTLGYLDEHLDITMDRDWYVRIALNHRIEDGSVVLAHFRKHFAQKTHQFNAVWEQNRLVVFSRLLNALLLDQEELNTLEKEKLYFSGETAYPISRSFSRKDKEGIVGYFLLDLARRNYGIQKFDRCFQITQWVKKYLAPQYTFEMERLSRRSRFYRQPVFRQLKRYYHKLIQSF